jgi:cohesin complex subunit SCC1
MLPQKISCEEYNEGKNTNLTNQESLMKQDQERPRQKKRKTRRPAASIMDYEQTIIPGNVYHSWLQNASDIASRRGRKRKVCP